LRRFGTRARCLQQARADKADQSAGVVKLGKLVDASLGVIENRVCASRNSKPLHD